jgi:hypothetical protein
MLFQENINFITKNLCGYSSNIYKGNIYVYGGIDAENRVSSYLTTFNIKSKEIDDIELEVTGRAFHSSVLYENFIYIIGGRTNFDFSTRVLKINLGKKNK